MQEEVFRLYVPVDDAVAMRVVEGGRHAASQRNRLLDRERTGPVESPAE